MVSVLHHWLRFYILSFLLGAPLRAALSPLRLTLSHIRPPHQLMRSLCARLAARRPVWACRSVPEGERRSSDDERHIGSKRRSCTKTKSTEEQMLRGGRRAGPATTASVLISASGFQREREPSLSAREGPAVPASTPDPTHNHNLKE